jgi:hypothetical protein
MGLAIIIDPNPDPISINTHEWIIPFGCSPPADPGEEPDDPLL